MGESPWLQLATLTGLVFSHPITSSLCTIVFHRVAHVEKAADALAIDTLLISDNLFRWFRSSISIQFRTFSSRIGEIHIGSYATIKTIVNFELHAASQLNYNDWKRIRTTYWICIHASLLFCAARHQDVPTRSRYVRLVDNVRDNGGNVRYQNFLFFRTKVLQVEVFKHLWNVIFMFLFLQNILKPSCFWWT